MRRCDLLSASALAAAPALTRPNVLILMTDQQRFDCLGANGNRILRTPHLDRLASQSANFRHAFVQSPVCVPSRVSYFTGRYAHCHRNRVNYTPCDSREVFWQRLMKGAGYRTGSVGKLHYWPPTREHAASTGWDHVYLDDGVPKTDPYSDYVRWKQANDPQPSVHYNAVLPGSRNPFHGATDYRYSPTWWTGMQTVELLREFAASPKPFFLFSSFFKPHSPYTVPEPFASLYDGVDIPLPLQVPLETIQALPKPVRTQILRGRFYDMDRGRLQWIYRSYYGAVSMVDEQIGKILEELDRGGKADNTIVIFVSDHGDQLLEHGLPEKNVFFEASVRVPCLIRYPARVSPGVREELLESIDLLPTVLSWCGIAIPKAVQGRGIDTYPANSREMVFSENVIPEVITGASSERPFVPGKGVAGVRHPDGKMVRTRRWKLNYYPGEGGELYDLENDPGETRNLFNDPARRGIVSDLKGAILDWMVTAGENDQIAERWMT